RRPGAPRPAAGPAATFLVSEKEPSSAVASPDPMSPELQAMLTSAACQRPSGWPHAIGGGAVSGTVMLAHVVAVRVPLLTVTQTMCVAGFPAGPSPRNTVGLDPEAVPKSPLQVKVRAAPSMSKEPLASSCTLAPPLVLASTVRSPPKSASSGNCSESLVAVLPPTSLQVPLQTSSGSWQTNTPE